MDFSTVAGVAGSVLGGAGAVFGWLVRRAVAQNDKKFDVHDEALKANARELSDYKLYAEQHFVTQGELTKAIGSLESTIQRLIESVNSNATEMREWFRLIQQTKADKP
jgi:uncharacterized membrane-anchored protein YhcB (DUF1043 family)